MVEITEETKEFLAEIGRIGGQNSSGGGRKPIPDDELTPAQRRKRAYNEKYRGANKQKIKKGDKK